MQVEERDRSIERLRAQLAAHEQQVKDAKSIVAGHGDWFRRMKVAEARLAALQHPGSAAVAAEAAAGRRPRPQSSTARVSVDRHASAAAQPQVPQRQCSPSAASPRDGAASRAADAATPRGDSGPGSERDGPASPFEAEPEPSASVSPEPAVTRSPARRSQRSRSSSASGSGSRQGTLPHHGAGASWDALLHASCTSLHPAEHSPLAHGVSIDAPDLLSELQAFDAPSEEPSSAQASLATPADSVAYRGNATLPSMAEAEAAAVCEQISPVQSTGDDRW